MNPRTLTKRQVTTAWMLGLSTLFAAQAVDAQPRWGRLQTPRAGACFYRDVNFRGDYFCASAGDDIAMLSRGMNNQVSSIQTFGNAEVTIFEVERFQGRATRVIGDVRDLRREGWNDRLSSLRVDSFGNRRGGYGDGHEGRMGSRSNGNDDRNGGNGSANGRDDRNGAGNGRDDRNGAGYGRDDRNGPGGRRTSEEADVIVRRVYQDVLGRAPDAQGLSLYRGRMMNEGWSEQAVRDALLKSPEYQQRNVMTQQKAEEVVARAYRSVLNREPDPASRGYVDKVLREHWTEADVAKELRNSPEYRSKHR